MCDSSTSTKICSYCDMPLPATEEVFGRDKNTRDGLNRFCKACRRHFAKHGYDRRKRPLAPQGYKVCPDCNEQLPATKEYFHEHSSGGYGLRSVCRKCRVKESAAERQMILSSEKIKVSEKKCWTCGIIKGSSHFGKSSYSRDGLKGSCLECRRESERILYHKDVEKSRRYGRLKAEREKANGIFRYSTKYWKNPELSRARSRQQAKRRRALKLAASGSHTEREFSKKVQQYDGRCHWCEKKIVGTPHADHLIALSRGGSDSISNIVPACGDCNRRKSNKLPHEWTGRLL